MKGQRRRSFRPVQMSWVRGEAFDGEPCPVRAAAELIADFVQGFVRFERHQRFCEFVIALRRDRNRGIGDCLSIGDKESGAGFPLPMIEPTARFRDGLNIEGAGDDAGGVIEGSQHPGYVLERGMLCFPLKGWPVGFTLEIDNQ